MNPQFMPPQFGAQSNFQNNNRASPSLGPSPNQFQSVPLGSSESGSADLNPANLKSGQFPPPSISSGSVLRNSIPSNQLPPSQGTESISSNPFSQNTNRNDNLGPSLGGLHAQNGTSGMEFLDIDLHSVNPN